VAKVLVGASNNKSARTAVLKRHHSVGAEGQGRSCSNSRKKLVSGTKVNRSGVHKSTGLGNSKLPPSKETGLPKKVGENQLRLRNTGPEKVRG